MTEVLRVVTDAAPKSTSHSPAPQPREQSLCQRSTVRASESLGLSSSELKRCTMSYCYFMMETSFKTKNVLTLFKKGILMCANKG